MNRNNSPKLLIEPKKSFPFISPVSLAFLTLSSLVLYPYPAGGAPETKTTVTNSQLEAKVKQLEKKYESLPTKKDILPLRKRVANQENQVKRLSIKLDNQVKSLPTKQDIDKLNKEIESFRKSTLSLSQVARWGIPFLLLNLVGSSLLCYFITKKALGDISKAKNETPEPKSPTENPDTNPKPPISPIAEIFQHIDQEIETQVKSQIDSIKLSELISSAMNKEK